ncbi:diguanylate cyclase domain-containing protein [Aureimonas endophytica]|nr:diguanylate cyclase [Aureimonas endophytica]
MNETAGPSLATEQKLGEGRREAMSGFRLGREAALWLGLAALLLAFSGVSALGLLELRHSAWIEATTNARNVLKLLSIELSHQFTHYDEMLRRAAAGADDPFAAAPPAPGDEVSASGHATAADGIVALFLLDADGTLARTLRGTPPALASFAGEAAFRAQRDDPALGLAMTVTPKGWGATGGEAIMLSRRLAGADGGFAGVAVELVDPRRIRALFAQAELQEDDVMAAVSTEGILLMRRPAAPQAIGRDFSGTECFRSAVLAPSGFFRDISPVDGVKRIYAFQRVDDLPLFVTFALSERGVFASWNRLAIATASALGLLSLLAIGLAFVVRRELKHRQRAEKAIRRSEARLRLITDHANDVIIWLNEDFVREYVSPACRSVFGMAPEDLVGRRSRDLIHPDDWEAVEQTLRDARRGRGNLETVYRLRHRDGHYVWVEARYGHVAEDAAYIVVLREVSRRKEAEERLAAANAELAALARTDGLTGLVNRRGFDEALARESAAAGADRPLSLLLMDLDRFKLFNDRYGHPAGDDCLRRVAAAIGAQAAGTGATVARYGGEELAVLLPAMPAPAAEVIGEGIRAAVESLRIEHPGNASNGGVATISLGCATIEHSRDGGGALVEEADRMLYEAKRMGRNRVASRARLARPAPMRSPGAEAERLRAVEAFRAASRRLAEAEIHAIAAEAAALLDAPVGFVSLVGAEEVSLLGRYGTDVARLDRSQSICTHTITGDEPLIVGDLRLDPRFEASDLVAGALGLRFYAGAPLFLPGTAQVVGAVCAVDFAERPPINPERRQALKDLANRAAARIIAAA